jgi:hypothetical protein
VPYAPTPAARRELIWIKLKSGDLRLLPATSLVALSLLRHLERRPPALLGPQMLGQLITTITAEEAVLPAVGLLSLVEDVGDRLLVGAVRAARSVGADLPAVDAP